MIRIAAWALVAVVLTAGVAPAQVVIVQSPPRVVTYSPPLIVPAPAVYSSPVTTYSYYPSTTVYSAPTTTYSYYPSTTVYSAPVVSYYPSTTVFSAPATVAVPGVVTTRSYVGLGIFRPRGVYTETYVLPR